MQQYIQKIRVGPVLAAALLTVLPRTGQSQNTPTDSTYQVQFHRVLPKEDSNADTKDEADSEDTVKNDDAPRLNQQQQQFFANRARCECNEKLEVRIQPQGNQASIPNDITDIRVGLACDEAMKMGSPYPRCVRLIRETSPQLNFVDFKTRFEINWLAHGLANASNEDLSNEPPPQPDKMCEHPGGSSGIWMCFGNDACTTGDFFKKPQSNSSTNDNSSGTSGGGNNNGQNLDANSITFDFNPPAYRPVITDALSGDGAVELRWDPKSRLDTYGYRVLCADERGYPIRHSKRPSNEEINSIDGTLYFTKNNLCPDPEGEDSSDTGTTGTGDGTTSGTDTDSTSTGGETTDGSTSGVDGTDSSTENTSESTTSTAISIQGAAEGTSTTGMDDGSPSGTTVADTDTTTGSEDTESEPPPDPSDEQILTLNWDFICSDHIPATADRIRIKGLANNKNYKFVLVAYDRVGNPTHSRVTVGTPRETDNLADLCQRSGNCGKQGFCAINPQQSGKPGQLGTILIVIATTFSRRRNRMVSRKR